MVTLLISAPVFITPDDFSKVRPKVVVDMRDPKAYGEGHIPGAVNFPVDAFLITINNIPFQLPPFDTLVEKIAALGVRQNESVLIYSSASLPYHYLNVAALYMVLKHLGFRKVFVLNGGYEAWLDADKPTSERRGLRGRIRLKARPDSSFIITLDSLLVVGDGNGATLKENIKPIDLRIPDYYFGTIAPPYYSRMGHIPKATNLPFKFFLKRVRGKNGKLYYVLADTSTVMGILKANLPVSKTVVFYGNTPREAAFGMLLLDHFNYPRKSFKLYLGGFSEWSRDTALPVVKYRWE
ncbi:MAG: sulfurtransferase [Thermotogae bacterium]|nr:sulfurtransferase [Thermotogota bacterium]